MRKLVTVAVAAVALAPAYSASFVGSQVTGSMTPFNGESITQQFTSPATVGAGTEFTGVFHDNGFNQNFNISADFSGAALVISFTSAAPNSNVSSNQLLQLDFGSTASLFPMVTSTVHSCGTPAGLCHPAAGLVYLNSETTTSSVISLNFNTLYAGDRYTLTFAQPAVPEPASWAMFIGGFGAIGFGLRRRRANVSFA